ncbi:MAG: flippase-like domain-containing protein [Chloroflexota bacterium]|nr:flippase-like domain-containing protein [Chloroflexota bacterium]
MTGIGDLRNKLLLGFAVGVAVVLALILVSDVHELQRSLRAFDWALIPLILALTLLNYALRFVKWHYYLGRIGARGVALRTSLGIFLSGLTMAMTPGKVGELLKSVLLRRVIGTPIAVSAPIVMAERLTDGLALLVLSAGGLILYRVGVPVLALIALLAAAVVLVCVTEVGRRAVLGSAARLPFVGSRMEHVHAVYESARSLLAPRPLGVGIGLGLVSWAGECLAFFLVLVGLGLEPTFELLLLASFVLGASTLIGSASLLPGGLGVADATVAGLLLLTLPAGAVDRSEAIAATLLIRFCTLWFGAGLGVVTLLSTGTRLGRVPSDAVDPSPQRTPAAR